MPFFLFMVGAAIPLALAKYQSGVIKKIVERTAKLFILGLLTQVTEINSDDAQGSDFPAPGSNGFDLKRIRIPGILQRIAWAYFILACMSIYFPKVLNAKIAHRLVGNQ